jgi:pimeloyl-ACP methyl ester carboxylesterase
MLGRPPAPERDSAHKSRDEARSGLEQWDAAHIIGGPAVLASAIPAHGSPRPAARRDTIRGNATIDAGTRPIRAMEWPVSTGDGHQASLLARIPASPRNALLWLPALGVAAKHYLPFADALAARGIAVFLHEWRGNGSSDRRAGRDCDWGYRELFADIAASAAAVDAHAPGLPRILGGHSLGGQLACCHLASAPGLAQALWLVASGSPYWRSFPASSRWWLPFAYRFLPGWPTAAAPCPAIASASADARRAG